MADKKINRGVRNLKDGKKVEENIEEIKKRTKCGICQIVGHWHRECPENPKNKSKQTGQLATLEATMEELTSPTKVRIDAEEQIVNPWAVSAAGDPERTFQERVDQSTEEWLGQAYELHGIPEEHQVQDGDELVQDSTPPCSAQERSNITRASPLH